MIVGEVAEEAVKASAAQQAETAVASAVSAAVAAASSGSGSLASYGQALAMISQLESLDPAKAAELRARLAPAIVSYDASQGAATVTTPFSSGSAFDPTGQGAAYMGTLLPIVYQPPPPPVVYSPPPVVYRPAPLERIADAPGDTWRASEGSNQGAPAFGEALDAGSVGGTEAASAPSSSVVANQDLPAPEPEVTPTGTTVPQRLPDPGDDGVIDMSAHHGQHIPNLPLDGTPVKFHKAGIARRLPNGNIASATLLGSKDPDRLGLEKAIPLLSQLGLPGYDRAHAHGRIIGVESPYGVRAASEEINRQLQAKGIEDFLAHDLLPQLRDGVKVFVNTEVATQADGLRLDSIVYRIEAKAEGDSKAVGLFELEIGMEGPVDSPRAVLLGDTLFDPDRMESFLKPIRRDRD